VEPAVWIAIAVLSAASIVAALALAIRQLVRMWRDSEDD
jgi:hypothetical protein